MNNIIQKQYSQFPYVHDFGKPWWGVAYVPCVTNLRALYAWVIFSSAYQSRDPDAATPVGICESWLPFWKWSWSLMHYWVNRGQRVNTAFYFLPYIVGSHFKQYNSSNSLNFGRQLWSSPLKAISTSVYLDDLFCDQTNLSIQLWVYIITDPTTNIYLEWHL